MRNISIRHVDLWPHDFLDNHELTFYDILAFARVYPYTQMFDVVVQTIFKIKFNKISEDMSFILRF